MASVTLNGKIVEMPFGLNSYADIVKKAGKSIGATVTYKCERTASSGEMFSEGDYVFIPSTSMIINVSDTSKT